MIQYWIKKQNSKTYVGYAIELMVKEQQVKPYEKKLGVLFSNDHDF